MKDPVAHPSSFESFGLDESLLKAIQEAGFVHPSPIQGKVIPLILSGQDIVAQAQTGTGKTAAFGLPALHLIRQNPGVGLLIITPTRELAQQVSDELYRYGKFLKIKTVAVYGGQSITRQVDMIRRGAQVVVATPGRLLDLLQSNYISDFSPSMVVLDEADEMLDMGFLEDIQAIFGYLPKKRQTLLFSATMPQPIQNLAKKILHQPVFSKAEAGNASNQDIQQHYTLLKDHERDDALLRLISVHAPSKSIVFCRTKKDVDRVATLLINSGYPARGLHGDMEQHQRQVVIDSFRDGKTTFLVATDVAARGLSIADVSHVFNYHLPTEQESYVHRIGRTGRAGKKGVAISLATPREFSQLRHVVQGRGDTLSPLSIPTLQQVREAENQKIMDEIKNQIVEKDASAILQRLQKEMDLSQIGIHLISMLLGKRTVSGPEQIGVGLDDPRPSRGPRFGRERPFRKASFRKDRRAPRR